MSLSVLNPTAERNLGLDLLRATAILMVLFNHWSSHFGYWWRPRAGRPFRHDRRSHANIVAMTA
jgi:peptidoglycan/LPS O-acetylase OafA/YrhL